ncbi:MauE/DoxX family redox-associated membrane protein [Actinomadura madurae]|uniref:MauE/DoxX family redox-associated membrane protein n=1 Tax=Actinomadura madurae TaxID=1993 RepID=UPI000DA0A9C6|nr:MauE/DoxX family redox-associated membrane protein [Actinomadura madurae]SPT60566.1 methylamine dehydrogenase accessory protein MauD [Actinomadura madurae]
MTVLAAAWPVLIVVLAAAVAGKVRDVGGFGRVIAGYRILPDRLGVPAAILVLAAETGAALLLALPITRRWGAVLAAALFAAFLGAMVSVLRRGMSVECGCFGANRPTPVGPASLARTGLLLLLSIAAVVAGPAGFSAVQPPLSVLALALVAAVPRLFPPVATPPAPREGTRFKLVAGPETVTDGPTLFALISPSCGLCTAMLPEFTEVAGRMRVVLVSAGPPDEIRAHLAAHDVRLPLVIDPDVFDANGIPWPPYAVVTDPDGTILAADGTDTLARLAALLDQAAINR